MGVVWSCLSVLAICCWSVIHPNVPGYKDLNCRIFWRKFGYTVLCLVVPEWVVMLAADQWLWCRQISKEVQELLRVEGIKQMGEAEVSQVKLSHRRRHSRTFQSCLFYLLRTEVSSGKESFKLASISINFRQHLKLNCQKFDDFDLSPVSRDFRRVALACARDPGLGRQLIHGLLLRVVLPFRILKTTSDL